MLAKFAGAPQVQQARLLACQQVQSSCTTCSALRRHTSWETSATTSATKLLPRSRQPGIQLGQKGCLSMIEALLQGELPPPRCSTEACHTCTDNHFSICSSNC
ncbi:TPA: hypothetical protein ACH3X2_001910 [Trebouxia sp. C0005]